MEVFENVISYSFLFFYAFSCARSGEASSHNALHQPLFPGLTAGLCCIGATRRRLSGIKRGQIQTPA